MASNQDNRESFVFYRSFFDVISTLEDGQKCKLLDMICELGLNRKSIDPQDKLLNQLFMLIRPQIDANYRKAIGGKKGGRPPKKPMVKPMVNPIHNPKGEPNVNGNANVNANVIPDIEGVYDSYVDPETGEVMEISN